MSTIASFLEARIHVLEHVVEGGGIPETLDILCRETEDIVPAVRCSVLIYDQAANCLRHAAGPSLPDYYNDAIDGLQPGQGVGSCGTAAFTGKRVIVEDVLSHPYWEAFRDLAKKVGFHACWSQPIYSKNKVVLGTFAMYYDEVRRPTEEELNLIQAQANLASLVIERKQTEEALKESEKRFRTFAESSSDWFWEMDSDLRFTYHSERYFEITGFSPEDKIGTSRTHYIDPAQLGTEKAKWDDHMADLRAHRPFKNFEYTFTVKDGSVCSVRISGEPFFDATQNFVGYRGTGTDITDHIKADLKLQESEQRFRDFAEASADWLWETDENLRFTYYSEGIEDVIGGGMDINNFLGKTRLEVAANADKNSEKWRRHMEDMKAHKPIRDFTYTYVTPNGVTIYFSVDGNPVYDAQGNFRGYRGVGHDITEKVLAADKIKASEERQRLIFESAAVPLAVIRLSDSVIISANSAWLERFGLTAEETGSVRMEDLYVDIAQRRHFLERLEADGRVHGMEAQFKHKNGETFYGSFNSFKTVLDDEDVVITGLIDISERMRAEQELKHHRDHLEELVAERTEEVQEQARQLTHALESEKKFSALQQKFVALVSHEFRTPLSIIDGTAQRIIRLKDKITPDQLVERGSKIRFAVERMVGLIETTLYASRLDAGKVKMHVQPCTVRELFAEVCDRQKEISPSYDIHIDLDVIPEYIDADPKLLEHIFTNLLSNAVKYAPDNPLIEVAGEIKGDMALISIKDQGLGIPENDLPHMFERFFRAKTAEGIKGTGLGLSVCKEFVEMHGGDIKADSVEGEGATFTLLLPIGGRGQ